jgi:hypothetical protein
MFDSSLLPVVCRRAHFLFTLFVFVCVVHSGFLGGLGFTLFPLYCQFLWIVLSKKDRQYNGKKKVNRTNDDLLNTTQKTTRGSVH